MSRYALVRAADIASAEADLPHARGLWVAPIIGTAQGSVHMEVVRGELEPGGRIDGHYHAYEESFFVLAGTPVLHAFGSSWALEEGSFGVVGVGVAHAWSNLAVGPARWLRIRAPQPRPIGDAVEGTFTVERELPQGVPVAPAPGDPTVRHLGRFLEDQIPPAGPVAMRGMNAYQVRNVSVRLMVDDTIGARHHVVFLGQMLAGPGTGPVPPAHWHPFEETYCFVQGRATAVLDGDEHDVGAGDVVFAGVNATHTFRPYGDDHLRWIETQVPRPPEQDSMFLEGQWLRPSGPTG